MTVNPNLLVTGILATIVSLLFILWAARFMHRKDGGLVLILLSVVMLLMGGGFGPPILGIIIGAFARDIQTQFNTGPGSIASNYPPAPQAAASSSRLEPR